MLKKLLEVYTGCSYWWEHCGISRAKSIVVAVSVCSFVRKGQEQMMADYLWLELLEQGRL